MFKVFSRRLSVVCLAALCVAAVISGMLGPIVYAQKAITTHSLAMGIIHEFEIPTPNSNPDGITLGPDGVLWFTEIATNQIGRITTDGKIREFPLPGPYSYPGGIIPGPDQHLWFTEVGTNKIGRISSGR
ncbi:MAG TPA: hypothetical protein VJ761_19540 [Ktedonobacteraceae bacterium]|nr:hypothetical protein [Ktedonobacteraceae bacterium]